MERSDKYHMFFGSTLRANTLKTDTAINQAAELQILK